MPTARFSQLVQACGTPVVHTSWVPPAQDAELQRALGQQRVVTLHFGQGGADFGEVGLGRDGQILIFPKSVRAYAGRKLVGVKYDLLAGTTPEPTDKERRAHVAAREQARRQHQEKETRAAEAEQAAARKAEEKQTRAQKARTAAKEKEARRETQKAQRAAAQKEKAAAREAARARKPAEQAAKKPRPLTRAPKVVPFRPEGEPAKAPDWPELHRLLRQALKALQHGKQVQAFGLLQQLDRRWPQN